jgi:hypothetical protein
MHLDTISAAGDATRPTTISELTEGERLLVSGFRRWILGWVENDAAHWKLVAHEFEAVFGPLGGKAALASFGRLVNILRLNACRSIEYHQPCCPCLGADEACLIVLVAAAQHGNGLLARAASEWLVSEAAAGDLLGCAALLAQALGEHLPALPDRGAPSPVSSRCLH